MSNNNTQPPVNDINQIDDLTPIATFFSQILPRLGFTKEQIQQKIAIAQQNEVNNVGVLRVRTLRAPQSLKLFFGETIQFEILEFFKIPPTSGPAVQNKQHPPELEAGIQQLLNSQEVFDCIGLIQNNQLQQFPTFEPAPNHPFYQHIKNARIPVLEGQPSFLLDGLPLTSQEIDVENDSDMEQLRPATEKVLELADLFTENAKSGNLGLMIGVSGCGKTRTIYEVLSLRYGLFFTASVGGNGGSIDIQRLSNLLERLPGLRDADGDHYSQCVLLARILVLNYLFKSTKLTPWQWLLIQIQPTKFLKLSTGNDLFVELFSFLIQYPGKIDMTLATELSALYANLGRTNLVVFMDEAQVLFHTLEGRFTGPLSHSARPLYTNIMNTWQEYTQLSIFCSGTGLELELGQELSASAILKQTVNFMDRVIVDFGQYDDATRLEEYLTKYFPIGNLQGTIFQTIQGRNRIAAYFAFSVVTWNTTQHAPDPETLLNNALQNFVQLATTKDHEHDPRSFRFSFARRLEAGKVPTGYRSIFEAARRLTRAYFYCGKKFVFQDVNYLKLVEYGICPLSKQGQSKLSGCIAEPLVALALYNFFQDIGYPVELSILEQLGESKLDATSCGLIFERFLITSLCNFLGDQPLGEHHYFKAYYKTLPAWIKTAQLVTQRHITGSWIRHAKDSINFQEFLQSEDKYPTDFFCPENPARTDAFFRLRLKDNSLRGGFVQIKLGARPLSQDAIYSAISTTSFKGLYTTKTGEINTQYKKRSQNVVEELKLKYQVEKGSLRILFTYPPADINPYVENNDVIMVLDSKLSPELFSEDIWQFLNELKLDDPVENSAMEDAPVISQANQNSTKKIKTEN